MCCFCCCRCCSLCPKSTWYWEEFRCLILLRDYSRLKQNLCRNRTSIYYPLWKQQKCLVTYALPLPLKQNLHASLDGWTNVLKAFHIFHVGFASVNFPHQECGRRKAFIELHALVKIQILLGPTTWWNQREFTVKLQKSFPSRNQRGCLLWNYILFRPGMKLSKQNFCDVETAGVFLETKSPKLPFLILLLGSTFPKPLRFHPSLPFVMSRAARLTVERLVETAGVAFFATSFRFSIDELVVKVGS